MDSAWQGQTTLRFNDYESPGGGRLLPPHQHVTEQADDGQCRKKSEIRMTKPEGIPNDEIRSSTIGIWSSESGIPSDFDIRVSDFATPGSTENIEEPRFFEPAHHT